MRNTHIVDILYSYFGLALGCIDADFCKYIPVFIFQHLWPRLCLGSAAGVETVSFHAHLVHQPLFRFDQMLFRFHFNNMIDNASSSDNLSRSFSHCNRERSASSFFKFWHWASASFKCRLKDSLALKQSLYRSVLIISIRNFKTCIFCTAPISEI